MREVQKKTSSHSDWQKRCIAATHGRFNRIRQVAPMCTSSNMFPLAHPSPYPKRHLDRFSRFCVAQAESLYFTMGRPFPLEISRVHGGSGPSSNTCFLEPITSAFQTATRLVGSAVFAQLATLSPYGSPFPLKIAPSNSCFRGPSEFSTQTTSRSVEPSLQG